MAEQMRRSSWIAKRKAGGTPPEENPSKAESKRKEIEDKIFHCGLNPSGIAKTDVEGVFRTLLGHSSSSWVDSLKTQHFVLEKPKERSQAYRYLSSCHGE